MELVLIAALAENRVIGYQGKIPWKIPEDLKRFRSLTLNHSIIMGRKTYESIGKPLDKRKNIVLTKDPKFNQSGVIICNSLEEALETCKNEGTVYVIGGQRVYEEAISKADRLEITHVHSSYKGDAFFPEIDITIWHKTKEEAKVGYSFATYAKINLERLLKAV